MNLLLKGNEEIKIIVIGSYKVIKFKRNIEIYIYCFHKLLERSLREVIEARKFY